MFPGRAEPTRSAYSWCQAMSGHVSGGRLRSFPAYVGWYIRAPSTPSSSLWCSSATLRRRLRLLRALLTGPYDFAKNFNVTHTFEPYKPNAENDVDMMYVGIWHTLHEAHVMLSELSS